MPCTYTESDEERAAAEDARISRSQAYQDLLTKLKDTTALLCEACTNLEDADWKFGRGKLADWWREHKAEDKLRLRALALSKLTAAEKRALNLK